MAGGGGAIGLRYILAAHKEFNGSSATLSEGRSDWSPISSSFAFWHRCRPSVFEKIGDQLEGAGDDDFTLAFIVTLELIATRNLTRS